VFIIEGTLINPIDDFLTELRGMDESGQSTPTPHQPQNSLSWMKGTFAGATEYNWVINKHGFL
jgi:hypothetical protein